MVTSTNHVIAGPDLHRARSSYVYGVFGAQRSRDCTVTVLVSQIKRGHVTALSQ